jgi:hypothetical protein
MSSLIPAYQLTATTPHLNNFISTGRLNSRVYEIVDRLNPAFIFCNCAVIAYKLAHLLERGTLPKLGLLFSNLPRPMDGRDIIEQWPVLFSNLGLQRTYVHVENVDIEMLQLMMKIHGRGTHAIVAGVYKNPIYADNFFRPVGHCWNYILDDEGKFIILDGYSRAYRRQAQKNPERYLRQYQEKLEAILFFNTKNGPASL